MSINKEVSLQFKDLTYHCNITDKEGLRVYKVIGWNEGKGSVDVVHHKNKMTASINEFKGLEITNEILNLLDIEDVGNVFMIEYNGLRLYLDNHKYLHLLQREYLVQTNKVLEYK